MSKSRCSAQRCRPCCPKGLSKTPDRREPRCLFRAAHLSLIALLVKHESLSALEICSHRGCVTRRAHLYASEFFWRGACGAGIAGPLDVESGQRAARSCRRDPPEKQDYGGGCVS